MPTRQNSSQKYVMFFGRRRKAFEPGKEIEKKKGRGETEAKARWPQREWKYRDGKIRTIELGW